MKMKIAAKRLDGAHRKVEKRQTRGFALCIRIHLQVAKEREREREGLSGAKERAAHQLSHGKMRDGNVEKKEEKLGAHFWAIFFFFFCLHHVAFTSRWPKARAYSTRRKCNAIMFVFTNPNWLIVRFHGYITFAIITILLPYFLSLKFNTFFLSCQPRNGVPQNVLRSLNALCSNKLWLRLTSAKA